MSITIYWVIGACILVFLLILFIFKMRMICAFFTAFLLIVFLRSGIFIVYEGSQVVITQFGDIVGKPYTEAGLYFKVPVIWKTNYLEKRIIAEEETQPGVATKDGYFITLNVVFLWKIVDGDKFISTMDDLKAAKVTLRNIVSGAVRQNVSSNNLLETVRSEFPDQFKLSPATLEKAESSFNENNDSIHSPEMLGIDNTVKGKRVSILGDISNQVNEYTEKFGIKVLNIFITSIQYSPDVEKMINQRMILERYREASRLRSVGRSEALRIQGTAEKDYQKIIAPAEREALITKGDAEAYATEIQARSFSQDREFYNYWRSLKEYQDNLTSNGGTVLMSTDLPFLNFMTSKQRNIARPNTLSAEQTSKEKQGAPHSKEKKDKKHRSHRHNTTQHDRDKGSKQ